jgi:hypothetical protein
MHFIKDKFVSTYIQKGQDLKKWVAYWKLEQNISRNCSLVEGIGLI